MARAYSGNTTWDRVVEKGLTLFWCLSEALYPGLAADGTITALRHFVSAKRTPSCKDSRRIAKLRHDQALKEGLDEVAKAGFRAVP